MALITLTTDFGLNDHYVGTMKGVILNINPAAQIVDICHSVQSYDLLEGALTVAHSYSYFPAGTIHVVVVDPTVGSPRRPILVDTGKYLFIAPDNGVLSFVYAQAERVTVRHITAEHYFLQPVSATFHGRDVFAPVAGWVSKGVAPTMIGDVITDYARFALPRPKPAGDNAVKGVVLRVDKFGNLITNFTAEDVAQLLERRPAFRISAGKGEVRNIRSAFAEGAPGEVFGVIGSMGFLEIVANRGSAAHVLGANKGCEVTFSWEVAAVSNP
ncbi:MAG: S-adenosyl-l-methionine hydroxide adenosyltransferase family protein [Terriglobales bacterium]